MGDICLGAWTVKKSGNYRFYFKVAAKVIDHQVVEVACDHWENDVLVNQSAMISVSQEESCRLLQLDCNAYSPLPGAVLGLKIHDLNITSSGQGFRYQKVMI